LEAREWIIAATELHKEIDRRLSVEPKLAHLRGQLNQTAGINHASNTANTNIAFLQIHVPFLYGTSNLNNATLIAQQHNLAKPRKPDSFSGNQSSKRDARL